MKKRVLGKTNISVNPIGFGGIPIQRVTKEEAKEVVREAIKRGVNFFDSARGYTCSEEYLGYALGSADVYIASKSMSRTYEGMKNDINISLNNLQRKYIDLYQIHNITKKEDFEKVISDSGAYRALTEAKENGLIKHIGITSHSYDFLNYLLDSEYNTLFDTIQFPYNFLEVDAAKLFKKAKEKNIGTIAMKPLAGGVISNTIPAIKYLLQDDNLSVLIPGMGSTQEVKCNLEVCGELTSDEIDYIERLRDQMKDSFCHRCGYCLPCTKGIDIPGIFTLENYYEYYGLKNWALSRYEGMSVKISSCIECKICMSKCPYNIDIVNRLKRIKSKFEV